jgi:hypothetical protein
MSGLAIGDRVEHAILGCQGKVEAATAEYVRVRWDDGKVGLLYPDSGMVPQSRWLLHLVALQEK